MSAKTRKSGHERRQHCRVLLAGDRSSPEGRPGQLARQTEWHNLVAFNRTAEIVRDYVSKGSQLLVEGKIQTRAWDDRETGQKKYRTEIFVYDLTLLSGRSDEPSRNSGYGRGNGRASAIAFGQEQNATGTDYLDQGISDDDIPF